MTSRLVTPAFIATHLIALHAAVMWFQDPTHATRELPTAAQPTLPAADAPAAAPEHAAPAADEAAPRDEVRPAPGPRPGPLHLESASPDEDRYLADLGNGWSAELTLDPYLQRRAERILETGRVPVGAVVVLDVPTGRVLALADRLVEDHEVAPPHDPSAPTHLALRALAPAASVFKLITAAALLDAGVSPTRAWRYTPAKRVVTKRQLNDPAKDAPKADLGEGIAHSKNGLLARLANTKLSREDLEDAARRFAFNRVVPFPLLTDASTAQVPRNPLERARMAAGFWHTRLTPLHGALIAASVANQGTMPAPRLVERVHDPLGNVIDAPADRDLGRVMSRATALALRGMMTDTVSEGTARRAFRQWPAALSRVRVAGKTGSLATREPVYTEYSWFVGFAPADDPQIAFAVLVVNGEKWWQRAPHIAREVLASWFFKEKKRRAKQEGVAAR